MNSVPATAIIASRDNKLIKQLRRLGAHSTAYRKTGQFWVEGEHLCGAAAARSLRPALLVLADSFVDAAPALWRERAARTVVLSDALFDEISGLESPGRCGFLLDLPAIDAPQAGLASVVLDRVQDAGNVGSILRSAAAFGFSQVLALKGSAALWSPKVLRAGMGAHFGLRLVEGLETAQALALDLPLIVTSSHHGSLLHQQALPWPCVWAFGHEGQGVQAALLSNALATVRIAQPGGQESLNVAAAAAICLYASSIASGVQTPT
ncbi:MAG: RNA methyltransferase [Burkholderiaceae bacterium]